MNRPIEFRAWDLKNKKWLHEELEDLALNEEAFQNLVYCDMEGLAVFHDGTMALLDECGGYAYLGPERFVLVQFTGLADKNGQKIFEGDILRADYYLKAGEVYFEGGKFCWSHGPEWGEIEPDHVEVIGNRFENSELLE